MYPNSLLKSPLKQDRQDRNVLPIVFNLRPLLTDLAASEKTLIIYPFTPPNEGVNNVNK